MSSIYLEVTAVAGAHIDDVAVDLCDLATRTGITCWVEFNGIPLRATPHADHSKVVKTYRNNLEARK
jgi:hypothetical protein